MAAKLNRARACTRNKKGPAPAKPETGPNDQWRGYLVVQSGRLGAHPVAFFLFTYWQRPALAPVS